MHSVRYQITIEFTNGVVRPLLNTTNETEMKNAKKRFNESSMRQNGKLVINKFTLINEEVAA